MTPALALLALLDVSAVAPEPQRLLTQAFHPRFELAQARNEISEKEVERLRGLANIYEAERQALLKEMEARKKEARDEFVRVKKCNAMLDAMRKYSGRASFDSIEYVADNCADFDVLPTSNDVKKNIGESKPGNSR